MVVIIMIINMIKRNIPRGLTAILFIIGSTQSALLNAHPHSWVDIETKIIGQDNQISGLQMSWRFDDMTSMYVLDDEDMSPENKQSTLQRLADDMLENMQRVHFMTYIGFDDQQHYELKATRTANLQQDGLRLILHFRLELITPIIVNSRVSLRVFDPSYYTDMSWLDAGDVQLSSALSARCKVDIVAPQANAQQMAYAMALPADSEADNNLGALFTQKAEVQCQ